MSDSNATLTGLPSGQKMKVFNLAAMRLKQSVHPPAQFVVVCVKPAPNELAWKPNL